MRIYISWRDHNTVEYVQAAVNVETCQGKEKTYTFLS